MFRISRRKLAISSMAVAAVLALMPAAQADTITRGGTLTYARYIDSELLDPVLNDSNSDIWIIPNIYDTLLLETADSKIEGLLATDWKFEDGGKTLRLTIRPGVKFPTAPT